MIVVVVERASPGLRGQLTRWMLEVRAGVFVGTLSARVRDKLWELVRQKNPKGGALLLYRARNEQGFTVEAHGDTSRTVFENEGLILVRKPLEEARRRASRGARQGLSPSVDSANGSQEDE